MFRGVRRVATGAGRRFFAARPLAQALAPRFYATARRFESNQEQNENGQEKTYDQEAHNEARSRIFLGLMAGAGAMALFALLDKKQVRAKYDTLDQLDKYPDQYNQPEKRHILPFSDVQKHNTVEDGVWVTFRGGVYDITSFLYAHPGGTGRLLMAGGHDLSIFWNVYRQHYRDHVEKFLEKYRIGSLSDEDQKKAEKEFVFTNPYVEDPKRHPDLLGCTITPWCGECRTGLLADNYYTPNELFYVRNHLPVPVVDVDDYTLTVRGNGIKETVFTLNEIKTLFPKKEVVSTLQCAGNRREDFHGERGVFISPHWVIGAISNAKWGGAPLREVLKYCGLDVDGIAWGTVNEPAFAHCQFEALDCDEAGLNYGGSIPIDKAVDPLGDCLVAYEMNDRPLPRDHGYPCRALAPGHAGTRQAKWLSDIIISSDESDRPWHQKSYRMFAPDISFEDDLSKWPSAPEGGTTGIKRFPGHKPGGLRLDQAAIVQEMPVQSLICRPTPNQELGMMNADEIYVRGVAWSGGGRGINRVDVSIDGGKHFTAAELIKPIKQRRNRQWGWYLFEKTLPLPESVKKDLKLGKKVTLDLTSKALNGDNNVQPERMEPFWNARGVCINHWYHVPVLLDPNRGYDYSPRASKDFGNTPSGGAYKKPWFHHGWSSETADKAAAHTESMNQLSKDLKETDGGL